MKKILLSLLSIGAVAVIAVVATGAFFSDTETSSDNVLQAGAIDLGIDNESYYNGLLSEGTTWLKSYDLDDGRGPSVDEQGNPTGAYLFYNFFDLKPGDYGEDTISLNVRDNESWLCVDVTLTQDDDVDCTEPELDDETIVGCDDPDADENDGELADHIEFLWWADDGDNVLEDDENTIHEGVLLSQLGVGNTATVALADSTTNIWEPTVIPVPPFPGDQTTKYIGKAWCFGDISADPLQQDGEGNLLGWRPDQDNDDNGTAGEPKDGGISCDGSVVTGNAAQTDRLLADISFSAVQSRHNDNFVCPRRE